MATKKKPPDSVAQRQARAARALARLLTQHRLPDAHWSLSIAHPGLAEGCVLAAYNDDRLAAVDAYADALGQQTIVQDTVQGRRRAVTVGDYADARVQVWTLLEEEDESARPATKKQKRRAA